ncbi:MAG: hypothetical protein IPM56_02720 [Ignavibacteriales bacterium]|nr:MAG: hypothetical protein IPM56_02720 [Ignavibacteriales bacterium]
MKRAIYVLGIILLLHSYLIVTDLQGQTEKKRTQKISVNDSYKYISINDILMWVSNNGDGSHDPINDGSGFYWPGGELATKSAIFEDGLVYGDKVNGQIRVNGNTHRQGLQAGKILSTGIADDPSLEKYRVHRIRKDWKLFPDGAIKDQLKKDYDEWPVEDGAPWEDINGDGIFTRGIDAPKFEGDEVLWYVSNDLDPSRTSFTYGSSPIGLEFQTTIYGYFADSSNILGNVVFKKYKIINKSNDLIEDMYFSYWSDDDVGEPSDDYAGCDTTLLMGFTYNGDNDDASWGSFSYGLNPPAVGHIFLETPISNGTNSDSAFYQGRWITGFYNVGITSFISFSTWSGQYWPDPQQGIYEGSLEMYNYMKGKLLNGSDIIDPTTNLVTKFIYAGDPVNQTGWYESPGWNPPSYSDKRYLMTSGPVNMSPGDTQEVVVAILIAKGTSNLNSITKLKDDARKIKELYYNGLRSLPKINAPNVKSFVEDKKVMLWWSTDLENYESLDRTLVNTNTDDSTYNFEGYKVWQFSDPLGNNPTLVKIFDIENDVINVKDNVLINGQKEYITVLISPNKGLGRHIEIKYDEINQTELNSGSPYYFAVTAYAYSPNSFKKIIESESEILTLIPGKKPIDIVYNYDEGDTIHFKQTVGETDLSAVLIVLDPNSLTGDTYELTFRDSLENYFYSLTNKTKGYSFVNNAKLHSIDFRDSLIYDGLLFRFNVGNWGNYYERIKNVLETNGPGGTQLSEPKDVFEKFNSTGKWKIGTFTFAGTHRWIQDLNHLSQINDEDIEIRFTESGSEYYTTGYTLISPYLRSDPKGKGRVPFEVWKINRDGSPDERLYIKTIDNNLVYRDTAWGFSSSLNRWESIYIYRGEPYQEPLPDYSGPSITMQHLIGHLSINGELPEPGTVIRINTYKPPVTGDVFTAVATAPTRNNFENAKQNIDQINIFPNPYFGSSSLEAGGTERIVRLTNLPQNVIVRIYSLAGVFIKRIDKETPSPWLDWDLRNEDGSLVGSGVYLVYLDMPGIGTKILKLAVVQSN